MLACTYLNNAWDLVLRALPLSDCLFKMNRFVFPNCKSLWIKASAKWLNVITYSKTKTSRVSVALYYCDNQPKKCLPACYIDPLIAGVHLGTCFSLIDWPLFWLLFQRQWSHSQVLAVIIRWHVVHSTSADLLWALNLWFVSRPAALIHSKKCWVKYNPALGKIWTNPAVGLLPRRLG